MSKMKKTTLWLCITMMALTIFSFAKPLAAFADDEGETVKFGVISDTHIGYTGRGTGAYPMTERTTKVLDWYDKQGVDSIVINGDLTESGGSQFTSFGNTIAPYVNVPGKYENPDKPRLITAMGNHDGTSVSQYENASGMKNTAHYVINGHNFITVGAGTAPTVDNSTDSFNTAGSTGSNYDAKTIAWLRARVDTIKAANPGKPIFIFMHHPVRNTFYVSNEWYTDSMGTSDATYLFRNDPEVVIFGGHIHSPNNDPRSIWQGGFTSVNVPTLNYLEMEKGYLGDGNGVTTSTYPKIGATAAGEGLIVEASESHVKITNYDFDLSAGKTNDVYPIPQTWEFDVDDSGNFPYTNAKRQTQKQTPFFDSTKPVDAVLEGKINVDKTNDTSVELTFDQAVMPENNPANEVIHSYKFDFKNVETGEIERSVKQWSDFMITKRLQKSTYSQVIGDLNPGTDYELTIHAYGSLQNESKQTLKTTFKTTGTATEPQNYNVSFNGTLDNATGNPPAVGTFSATNPRTTPNSTASEPIFGTGSAASKKAINLGYWSDTNGGTPTLNSFVDLGTAPIDYKQSFTVAFKVKIDKVSGGSSWPAIFSNKDWGSGNNQGFMFLVKNNQIVLNSRSASDSGRLNGSGDINITPVANAKDRFVHLAAVYDKTGGTSGTGALTLYVDGQKVGSTWNTNLTNGITSGKRTLIGQSDNTATNEGPMNNGSAHNDYISLFMENFRLQNGAMTAEQIAELAKTSLEGTAAIDNINPRIGDTLSASLEEGNNTGTLKYQWKVGDAAASTASTYRVAAKDIGKTITVDITSDKESGTATSAATAAVLKRVAPAAPAAPTLDRQGASTVYLTAKVGYEYSKDGTNWQASNVFRELQAKTDYTFYQRIAETATREGSAASAGLNVTIPANLTSITGATVSAVKSQIYTGAARVPAIKVSDKGKVLVNNKDYTVAYTNNKNIGRATITITGKGDYNGKKAVTFAIIPKTMATPTMTVAKKKMTVKWKRIPSNLTRYQIQYKLTNAKTWKTINVTGGKSASVITKLTTGKKYHVRIRGCKTVNKANYYGAWSKARISNKIK